MDWNCFYAFLCHDGWKLTEGKKIWLYHRICVCVRKSITFSPLPLSFLGVAQLLVFKSYNIAAAAYYTYFGTQAFLTAWLSAFMV